MDFAAAGLLEGLEGEERDAREELLEWLADQNFSLEALKAAAREERLPLLPVERVLGGRYTAAEIAERTGLPADLLIRIRRLLGLPHAGADEREFGEEEVAGAQSTKMFIEAGMAEEAIAEITRVLGEGMSRLSATAISAFAETFLQAGDSEQEVAARWAALAEQLVPAMSPVLLAAFTAHLRDAVQRAMISRAELEAGRLAGEQEMAVCFADLVGFTSLGGQLEADELGSVVGRFGQLANDVGATQVRLVKMIGDAAMFSCRDAAPLVDAALSLVEAAEQADLPSLRAGVAFGETLPRAGDLFGHTVNLASRVTGLARPGSVLCTPEVHAAAGQEFDWSYAGKHRLKGVGDSIPLYRARRLEVSSEADSSEESRSRSRKPKAAGKRKRQTS